MTDVDIQDFVSRFAAAWAARDPEAFLELWHPDGVLRSPLYDRSVAGKELGRLAELVRQSAPDHVWQLLDWTARGRQRSAAAALGRRRRRHRYRGSVGLPWVRRVRTPPDDASSPN